MESRSVKQYIEFLEQRNLSLRDKLWREDDKSRARNEVYLTAGAIPFEYLAVHAGPKNQRILTPSNLDRDNNLFRLDSVFFSTSVSDLEYYLKEGEALMVYFADLRNVNGARVQKCYKHQVLFHDEITDAVFDFHSGKKTEDEVKSVIQDWVIKYTVEFNPLRIKRYKTAGDYILISAPIRVSIHP